MQGWRISMEDAHAAILDLQPEVEGKQQSPVSAEKRMAYFGVYDGHGGEKVAQFAGENIHKIVAKQEAYSKGDIEQALKDGFLATDRAILSGTVQRVRGICSCADPWQIRGMKRKYQGVPPRLALCLETRYGW